MDLEDIYQEITDKRGSVANIHKAFSDFPEGIKTHFDFYESIILSDNLPLSRRDREHLAVQTSKSNECPYCINHHEEALKKATNGELADDQRQKFLDKLARTLTIEPWKASPLAQEAISIGLTTGEFQHAVMVVSYFNFANRCAHAMGLELEQDFENSCS